MPKVLVLFYSRTGDTARIADAIAEGARAVRFTEVDVRRLEDLAPASPIESTPAWAASRDALAARYRALGPVDELADYDALVLGSPGDDGRMAPAVEQLLAHAAALQPRGRLVDKVGGAFTGTSPVQGGPEPARWSILTSMAQLGMILVPPAPTDAPESPTGTPAGTPAAAPPTDAALVAARHHGRRLATVAEWVRHAKGHEAAAHGQERQHHH